MSRSALAAHGIDDAVPFAIPLRRRFRGTDVRVGLLLRVGEQWGEWAPFPEYDDVAAARWLAGALEAARGAWPEPLRDQVGVNAIVPALGAEQVARLVEDAVSADGCSVVKVKVGERGQAFDDDVVRVATVREVLDACGAPDGRIRVDVNGAWSVDEAAARLPVLDDLAGGLEYAEQPCATLDEQASLRARVDVRLAVDEAVRLAGEVDDALVARVRESADVLVVKAVPMGGVRRALDVADAVGLPVTVSGSLDSSVGLCSGLALAAALPEAPLACGLGTGRLLATDLTGETMLPADGRMSVVRRGPDPAMLAAARSRVADDVGAWWSARLERCLALVGEEQA